jgi:hypothetical protein
MMGPVRLDLRDEALQRGEQPAHEREVGLQRVKQV